MIKRYFTYIPLWLSILVNAILGVVASGAFLLGLIYIGGLFAEPTPKEQLLGWLILVGLLGLIFLVNYIMYRIFKKRYKGNEAIEKKGANISFIIVCIVLIICVLGFFIFPDAWIQINGYWF